MGTRLRLGKGFTVGRSGLRYGHSIPGIPRSYLSVGRSGTLIAGGPLRHWEPAARHISTGTTRCQGVTKAGNQCANRATLGTTCRLHEAQAAELGPQTVGVERRDNRWGPGAWLALLALLAFFGGLSWFISSAEASYCAKNTGYARDSIPVCATYHQGRP